MVAPGSCIAHLPLSHSPPSLYNSTWWCQQHFRGTSLHLGPLCLYIQAEMDLVMKGCLVGRCERAGNPFSLSPDCWLLFIILWNIFLNGVKGWHRELIIDSNAYQIWRTWFFLYNKCQTVAVLKCHYYWKSWKAKASRSPRRPLSELWGTHVKVFQQ